MTYDAIKAICDEQLDTWLIMARENPALRNTDVWRNRIVDIQNKAQFPELESRYVRHLEGLQDTSQRVGLCMLCLALVAYQQAGERALWGYCLKAACKALGKSHTEMITWFNEQNHVVNFVRPVKVPTKRTQREQTRLLN